MTFNSESAARGKARQLEIATLNKVETADLIRCMVGSLQREPTPGELVTAEMIAATLVKSRRLRDVGRDDRAERRELAQLVKGSPWAATPAPSVTTAP